jgi:RimJ/RimL family protein N-acetyltransferase
MQVLPYRGNCRWLADPDPLAHTGDGSGPCRMDVVTSDRALSRTLTSRLVLTSPVDDDLAELFELHTDPRVWTHLPSGRHVDLEQTRTLVANYTAGWAANGLDVWVARDCETGVLVGMGGPSLRGGRAWNIYYRLSPAVWGRGYAQEIVAAARAATVTLGRDLPHVALLLEHNEGSRRAAERAGLQLIWRGADRDNPDPSAVRRVYADRPLCDADLALFV